VADFWYYSHDTKKIGPCSGRQMRDLADSGGILLTDTVWKEGIVKGVAASKFRKKCTTCGHADNSWNTLPIRNGVMRAGFYCIKCRKHRDVEVHGSLN